MLSLLTVVKLSVGERKSAMRVKKQLVLVVLCFALTGFSNGDEPIPNYPFNIIEEGDVPGMYNEVKKSTLNNPARVLLVHGMRKHPFGWSDKLQQNLGNALHLSRPDECIPLDIKNNLDHPPADNVHARMNVCTFSSTKDGHSLRFYELTWSPLTALIKDRVLGFDDDKKWGSRSRLNEEIKHDVINEGLSDSILYLGNYGPIVKWTIRQAICIVALKDIPKTQGDQPCVKAQKAEMLASSAATKNLYIITHSLGSAILYDTLNDLRPEAAGKKLNGSFRATKAEKKAAALLQEQTRTVYMFANQLPLLCLGRYQKQGDCEAVALEKMDVVPTSIVAFTDRNDLLTYPLHKGQLHLIGLTGDPLNVIVENGGLTINLPPFPSVTHPVTSHTGYQDNPSIMKMLACGTVKKALGECK